MSEVEARPVPEKREVSLCVRPTALAAAPSVLPPLQEVREAGDSEAPAAVRGGGSPREDELGELEAKPVAEVMSGPVSRGIVCVCLWGSWISAEAAIGQEAGVERQVGL